MITLTVVFCLTLNSYICQELRMVPEDYRAIASPMECIIGGAIGSVDLDVQFKKDGAEWKVRGYRCEASPPKVTDIQDWLDDQRARAERLEPQIK